MKKSLLLLCFVGSLVHADESIGDKIVLADHMRTQPTNDTVSKDPQPTAPTGESLLTKFVQACGKEGSSLDVYALTSEAIIKVIALLKAVARHRKYCEANDPFLHDKTWS